LGKNTDREKTNLLLVAWVSLKLLGTSKVNRNKELGRKKTDENMEKWSFGPTLPDF